MICTCSARRLSQNSAGSGKSSERVVDGRARRDVHQGFRGGELTDGRGGSYVAESSLAEFSEFSEFVNKSPPRMPLKS
jgi:hypothetical protein